MGVDLARFAGAVLTSALVMHEGETRIAQNTILGCAEVGILVNGTTSPSALGSSSGPSWFARLSPASSVPTGAPTAVQYGFTESSRVDILANVLSVRGAGIAAGSSATRIAGNEISGVPLRDAKAGGGLAGIVIVPSLFARSIAELQVDGNRIHDVTSWGIVIEARVDSALIKRNQIARSGVGGIAVGRGGITLAVAVEDNQIVDIAPELDERTVVPAGIEVLLSGHVTVARNEIVGVATNSFSAPLRTGIHAIACQSIRIAGNDVRDVGPDSDFTGASVGIEVEGPYEQVDLLDNRSITPDYGQSGLATGVAIAALIGRGPGQPSFEKVFRVGGETHVVEGPDIDVKAADDAGENMVRMAMLSTSSSPQAEQASPLLVRETRGTVQIVGPGAVMSVKDDSADVAVRGNLLQGAGQASALLVRTPGDCLASDNRCALMTRDTVQGVAWIEATNGAIVSSNRVEGISRESIFIRVPTGKVAAATVLGNITSGLIRLNYQVLGNPWAPLNVRW